MRLTATHVANTADASVEFNALVVFQGLCRVLERTCDLLSGGALSSVASEMKIRRLFPQLAAVMAGEEATLDPDEPTD